MLLQEQERGGYGCAAAVAVLDDGEMSWKSDDGVVSWKPPLCVHDAAVERVVGTVVPYLENQTPDFVTHLAY